MFSVVSGGRVMRRVAGLLVALALSAGVLGAAAPAAMPIRTGR
ncbi:hypothetical protein [Streptomyces sp. PCS3-D2]|nr:hypothetical protein [Streptomyces sp. PCS3-D2]